MGKQTISFEIDESDMAELTEWARSSERPTAELLDEALQRYLRYTRTYHAAIEEGLDDIRRGRVLTTEQVFAGLEERRRAKRAAAE